MSVDDVGGSKQKPLLVLGKITEILDAFSLAKPSMTLCELQQATGLPTWTVQRLVSNMAAQGFSIAWVIRSVSVPVWRSGPRRR